MGIGVAVKDVKGGSWRELKFKEARADTRRSSPTRGQSKRANRRSFRHAGRPLAD